MQSIELLATSTTFISILLTLTALIGSYQPIHTTTKHIAYNTKLMYVIGITGIGTTTYTVWEIIEASLVHNTVVGVDLTTQVFWGVSIVLFSVYTHIQLFAAYHEYTYFPENTPNTLTQAIKTRYIRWTYIIRNDFRKTIASSTIVAALAIAGISLNIPTLICIVLAGYHSVLMLVSAHGSSYIDYNDEQLIIEYTKQSGGN